VASLILDGARAPAFLGTAPVPPIYFQRTAKAFTDGSIADLNTAVQSAGISGKIGTRHAEKLFLQVAPPSDKVRAPNRGDVPHAFPLFP
jgi:hypothetical protein